jgi:hypothetical protein
VIISYHNGKNVCGEKLLRQYKRFVAIVYFNQADLVVPKLYRNVHSGCGDKFLQQYEVFSGNNLVQKYK